MTSYRDLKVGESLEHGDEVHSNTYPGIWTVVYNPTPGFCYTEDAASLGYRYRRPAVPPAKPAPPPPADAVAINIRQSEAEIRERIVAEIVPLLQRALLEVHNEFRFEAVIANQADSGNNIYNDFAIFVLRRKTFGIGPENT